LVKLLVVTAVVSVSAASARAAVLAYEGFDYPANTLLVDGGVGLGGGTGWAGPWDEAQALSFATTTQANSLQYTDSRGNVLGFADQPAGTHSGQPQGVARNRRHRLHVGQLSRAANW
jgi:hypothetical protein